VNVLHFVASPSPGGIETYVKDLAVRIAAEGHSAHICFLENAHDAGTSEEYEKEYLSDLESAGVQYFIVGKESRQWHWIGMFKIRKYVSEYSIDVYHSHLTYGIVFGALVRIPRVYTHHSIDMRVSRLVFTLISQFIEQLVGISDKCSKTLSPLRIKSEQLNFLSTSPPNQIGTIEFPINFKRLQAKLLVVTGVWTLERVDEG
jgi:glycosyltransferase involved in cell wall biosynthesis